MTTGEISAHFAEIYEAWVSKGTVSRITDKVVEDCAGLVDAAAAAGVRGELHRRVMVKVRDGQVGNQPFHAAMGVDLTRHRDVLGLWAGHGAGESAEFGTNVLTELENRGVADESSSSATP